jgi:hypothetical protein
MQNGSPSAWCTQPTNHSDDQRSRAKYAALRPRGHGHGGALRSIADRLLAVACAKLETRTIFEPSFTAKRASADRMILLYKRRGVPRTHIVHLMHTLKLRKFLKNLRSLNGAVPAWKPVNKRFESVNQAAWTSTFEPLPFRAVEIIIVPVIWFTPTK